MFDAKTGKHTPQMLYSLVCGIMRYVAHPVELLHDALFAGLQRTLDGEMTRLRALGLGVKIHRAERIGV